MSGDPAFERGKELADRRGILEAILVSSTTDDSSKLPTIKEFILSEIVNGTIAQAGGNAGQVIYQKFRFGDFERELIKYFNDEMSRVGEKIDPRIRAAIQKMTECTWVYIPKPGGSYMDCELYQKFRGFGGAGGICPVIFHSTFSLPQETVTRVQKDVLPSLPDQERRDVEGIGRSMRRFIDDDLEFISKTYEW